jgi:hypothetical protein
LRAAEEAWELLHFLKILAYFPLVVGRQGGWIGTQQLGLPVFGSLVFVESRGENRRLGLAACASRLVSWSRSRADFSTSKSGSESAAAA